MTSKNAELARHENPVGKRVPFDGDAGTGAAGAPTMGMSAPIHAFKWLLLAAFGRIYRKRQENIMIIGIMAHVDSGKTTLSEAMLYISGNIKKLGRVDHKDAYLDTHALERERGITIFSKQARLKTENMDITLLDTPGHADFSSEMERVLPVLDYAILVVSGTDGVQAHTETIWQLLRRYKVPTFIFVNKMDLAGADKSKIMENLHVRLSSACVDFSALDGASAAQADTSGAGALAALLDDIAMCDEELLESYMHTGTIGDVEIAGLVSERKLFPCCFGSALRLEGVDFFLDILQRFTQNPSYPSDFGARVYKIARDYQGTRLTYMKVTGGSLSARQLIKYTDQNDEAVEEKVVALRLYSGAKYEAVDCVEAGEVCAVTGLTRTWPGQGLGADAGTSQHVLEPVMSYRIVLPPGEDVRVMLPKLRQLEEEDPMLHIVWNEHLKEITAQLMGEVQIDVLKSLIKERFDVAVDIDSGRIMYKETIAASVEGVGHFEPLRHYAEVHLLLEPLPAGSGLVFDTACSTDVLDLNWQGLILTHLKEKQHLGVLTGSPITDMKVTVIAGRAHPKHTEGGDFRQATYRALRQGLMMARSVLLEPVYSFSIELASEHMGRAISDIRMMHGKFELPKNYSEAGDTVKITGTAPVSTMNMYQKELALYTHGKGKLACTLSGYEPCHDAARVEEELAYDPESDMENTPDSVFCAHGAGFVVKWSEVPDYMHIDTGLSRHLAAQAALAAQGTSGAAAGADASSFACDSATGVSGARGSAFDPSRPRTRNENLDIDEKELEDIMLREFGPIKRPQYNTSRVISSEKKQATRAAAKEYIIVDGYNIIFAWDELKKIAEHDLEHARTRLADTLAGYRAYRGCELVLVFDAYRVKDGKGSRFEKNGIRIVYTEENETGDMYIQKLASSIGQNYRVRVVTSDALIQLSALHSGVLRVSSREFELEVRAVEQDIEDFIKKVNEKNKADSKFKARISHIDSEKS